MLTIPLASQLVTSESQLVASADETATEFDYGDGGYNGYTDDGEDDWNNGFDFDADFLFDLDEPEEDDLDLEFDFDFDLPEDESMVEFHPSTGVIIGTDANVYLAFEDELGVELLAVLPVNTNVHIIENSDQWYQIKFADQSGWIHATNIESTMQIAVVVSEVTSFRTHAEHDAKQLYELPNGTLLRVDALEDNWARVIFNDEEGWIYAQDLAIETGRRPGVVIYEAFLYETPSDLAEPLIKLPLESQVMVIQRTRETATTVSWSQVNVVTAENTHLSGWIQTDKLIFDNQVRYLTSTEDTIALITSPIAVEGDRKHEMPTGHSVVIMAEADSWSYIAYVEEENRFYGWVANEYLSVLSPEVEENEPDIEAEDEDIPVLSIARTSQITTLRDTGVTVVDNVVLRSGPGTDYPQLGRLSANTNVRITGRDGIWNRIVHGGETFWVRRNTLRRTIPRAIVLGDNVPVRASASANANILTHASHGTRVNVTRRTGSWALVTVSGHRGWIRVNELRIANGRVPGRVTRALNLHERPNESSRINRRLSANQEVMIVQRTTNGTAATAGWTQVIVIDTVNRTSTGWVRTEFVERGNHQRVIGGASQLTVRQGPGTSFNPIQRAGRIPRNTNVTVLSEATNWSRIRFNLDGRRHEGWVNNRRVAPIHTMHNEIQIAIRNLRSSRNGIAISYVCLVTQRRISNNGNRNFFTASTIKLPTNMMVAEAVHEGRLSWNQRLTITQSDWLGGSGILQHQASVGQQFTIYELMRLSITHSDNIAHRMLARTVVPGFQNEAIGLDNSRAQLTHAIFNRYLPGHQRPNQRMIMTANQLTEIYRILHRDQHRIEGFRTILHYQRNTSWNDRFITSQTRGHVAHTPGWTHPFQHDSGTFFTDHPYILVVYTEGAGGIPFLSQAANEIFRINRRFDN